MLFVAERRRSRRVQSAIRAERAKASEAIQLRVSVHARSLAILVRARREPA
jgi:hypothetical protein